MVEREWVTDTGEDAVAAPAEMRASDAERCAAAHRLQVALGEGRLDIGEAEARLTAVYAARFRSELSPLLADLPVPETAPEPGGWATLWQTIVDQVWLSSASARGADPARPDPRQRRAVTAVLIAAALWAILCLLGGFTAGLLG
jgi:Domain of unknown function (DUF1707)